MHPGAMYVLDTYEYFIIFTTIHGIKHYNAYFISEEIGAKEERKISIKIHIRQGMYIVVVVFFKS